jgi:hypothetical protein
MLVGKTVTFLPRVSKGVGEEERRSCFDGLSSYLGQRIIMHYDGGHFANIRLHKTTLKSMYRPTVW